MKLAEPDDVEMTLTITLTVRGWKRVSAGQNWNPFNDAVLVALKRVRDLETDTEIAS